MIRAKYWAWNVYQVTAEKEMMLQINLYLGWAKWKNISETVQISSLFIPGHNPDNEWWPAPSRGLQILFSLSKHVVFVLLVNLLESEVWIITGMGDIMDMRAPQLWRRPHAKIYGYNQDFSANYYSVWKWWIIQNLSSNDILSADAGLCENKKPTGNIFH